MEYFTIELCEILLDLTALFVCIFIVLFIIISTFKNKRKISGIDQQEQTDKETDNFNEALMAQLIKQQFDKSLADVVGAINDEKLLNNKVAQEKVDQENIVQEKVKEEEVDQNKIDQEEIDQEGIDQKIINKKPTIINAREHEQTESNNSEIINKLSADTLDSINDEKISNTKVDQEPEEIFQVEVVKEEVINEEIIKEEVAQEENIKEAIIKEPEFIDSNEHNHVESEKIEEIDKYDEAVDLAKSGMDVYAIADKVKLPMGEIEVIVNLNRLRNEVQAA